MYVEMQRIQVTEMLHIFIDSDSDKWAQGVITYLISTLFNLLKAFNIHAGHLSNIIERAIKYSPDKRQMWPKKGLISAFYLIQEKVVDSVWIVS